jgi:RNA polymerase sigma factor (sigma-70 family)
MVLSWILLISLNNYLMNSVEINELIAGCKSNNPKYQTILYNSYRKLFSKIISKYCNDSRDIEEVINTAMAKIFMDIKDYKYIGPFEGWMRKIVVHTAINKTREKLFRQDEKGTIYTDFSIISPSISGVDEIVLSNDLVSITKNLTKQQKRIFELRVTGLKLKEIADKLGTSEGTVRFQVSAARKRLKPLEKEYLN